MINYISRLFAYIFAFTLITVEALLFCVLWESESRKFTDDVLLVHVALDWGGGNVYLWLPDHPSAASAYVEFDAKKMNTQCDLIIIS